MKAWQTIDYFGKLLLVILPVCFVWV